ncbi:MAG TPA: methyltransferase domain-containing protein [Bacillota bacterium]|nr:methyltransferase domain-containing protein [Bacillota bacterium]
MNAEKMKLNSLKKFDQDAPDYESTSDGQFCARAYPAILEELNRGGPQAILDVGCGPGILLSGASTGSRLYGIDLSANMIDEARKKLGDRAELAVGDAEKLPWREELFDTVLCTFSFHHYPNPDGVLSEMRRVLKTGGRLILADPWLPSPFLQLLNLIIRYSRDGDIHEYSKKEIETLLRSNGFQISTYRHPAPDSFLLTAIKG